MNKKRKVAVFVSAIILFALAALCRWLDKPSPVTFEFFPLFTLAFMAPLLATGFTILVAGFKKFWRNNRHGQLPLLLLVMFIPCYIAALYTIDIFVFRFDFLSLIVLFFLAYPFLLFVAIRNFWRKRRRGWFPLVLVGVFFPCYVLIVFFIDWRDYIISSEFFGGLAFMLPFMIVPYSFCMGILCFVQWLFDKME